MRHTFRSIARPCGQGETLMNASGKQRRAIWQKVVQSAMLERDSLPDLSVRAHAEREMDTLASAWNGQT